MLNETFRQLFQRFVCLLILFICCAPVSTSGAPVSKKPLGRIAIQADLGKDNGQNFGSLFEACDESGRVTAGAGFLGAYNTQPRSNRRKLCFFIKMADDAVWEVQRLPRPSPDAGVYLFDHLGRLFATTRSGATDNKLRYWSATSNTWVVDDSTTRYCTEVADGVLEVASKKIFFEGASILTLDEQGPNLGAYYYANGFFVTRVYDSDLNPPINKLVACPWNAYENSRIDLGTAHGLPLRSAREFVYAYGQLGEHVLAATNTGGVYRFDGRGWRVLVEPELDTSYQIYSMINYYDRLLMGHYPTGELFEYDGERLERRAGWPPVMPGVASQAREAQTTAIYGGDLLAGVWPWAEIWRYDADDSRWRFVRRMFTHPEPTDKTRHPYENETGRVDEIRNLWGQRVTSMVPFGDALYVGTSAKTSMRFDPKYEFLSGDTREEYGAVYRIRIPGQLAVRIQWVDRPTTFEFKLFDTRIEVAQDGQKLGSVEIDRKTAQQLSISKIQWGGGVYGPLRGRILASRFETAPPVRTP